MTDRRVSCYSGGTSRQNTRASLNAVSGGRSALNAARLQLDRDPPLRHRYVTNPGAAGCGGYPEQMLVNSTAALPPAPDAALFVVAGDDGDRADPLGRPLPPPNRHPVTVAVLADPRPPSALPVDQRRPTSQPRTPLPNDDNDDEAIASMCSAVAVVDVVSRTNHHICDSDVTDVPTSSTPPQQQQEQQHIV